MAAWDDHQPDRDGPRDPVKKWIIILLILFGLLVWASLSEANDCTTCHSKGNVHVEDIIKEVKNGGVTVERVVIENVKNEHGHLIRQTILINYKEIGVVCLSIFHIEGATLMKPNLFCWRDNSRLKVIVEGGSH